MKSWKLMAAAIVLSWCVNVRFPAETAMWAWVLPSADVAVLLGIFTVFGAAAPSVPGRSWLRLSCAWLLIVRLGRVAEGVCQRYFDRSFHIASDLPLLPELARLGVSTLGTFYFVLALVALSSGIVATWWLTRVSLDHLTRKLAERRSGNAYLVVALSLACAGPWLSPQGSFYASSVTPRLFGELEQWLTAWGWLEDPARAARRRAFLDRFAAGQRNLAEAGLKLTAAGEIDVHIVLVEAYGRTVQSTPIYAERLAPSYQAFSEQVAAAGFAVCSDFVRATILGGSSWLTHATLQTGVPVYEQFEYGVLTEHEAVDSLAKAFGRAGYRTVSVKPGTTRPSPWTRMYGFDREYTALDLDYHGRAYAWAPMPDQFVLQRVAERELRSKTGPLFVEYALVSSHFPFNPRPPYVEDWNTLGDGSIFRRLPASDYHTSQFGVFAHALGYLDGISYELRTLGTYLTQQIAGDALVLVLGDHQPIAPIAGEDHSRYTPMHVLSRRAALLDPFRARGCVTGMHGSSSEPQWTMEELGASLLRIVADQASAQ